jgi:Putative beta-barrel porin-2, OmpL-like. bbp2
MMSQILKSKAGVCSSVKRAPSGGRTLGRHARRLMLGAAAMLTTGLFFAQPAMAADNTGDQSKCDPYKDYSCLDSYLGDNVTDRIWNYYKLEWGEAGAPTDPNAQPSRRDGWPATPMTAPPMPFTEWPYGGTQNLGVTRPNAVDSPLMVGIANTGVGHWMSDEHIQMYGWVDPGFNVSSNSQRPGGNFPIAYSYTPNTAQLDQAVLYIERVPDTVQSDHIDWGFRISGIYGENYRYTTAYGIASSQLLHANNVYGYDFPMMYFELFVPQIGVGGTDIRIGRFISLPDIEAQLAPNNYMYSHSLTYAYDNYTNEGIQTTIGITKNFFLQLGVTVGTEAPPWHMNQTIANPDPNPLFPNARMRTDPGAQPSGTACIRYTTDSGNDNVNACADGINHGNWGYNNLQWYGLTYYHKFDDHWHISTEGYWEHQSNVLNATNPTALAAYEAGGTPFSPQYMPFNAPSLAQCSTPTVFSCTANALGAVAYINYSPEPLDNISLRPEFYDDAQGQRTGTKTSYVELSLGWQHWLSPQIEMRPEIGWYQSLNAPAFNGDSNAGIPANRNTTVIGQGDIIIHF